MFAPRNLQPGQEFTYWHINYDGPAHMQYTGQQTLHNLNVLKYETRYEGVEIDQTQNLTHLPNVGITKGIRLEPYLQLWVEPTTGRIVQYADDTIAYFYDLETGERLEPWNHFTNTFSESSVRQIVDETFFIKAIHRTVAWYIPIALAGVLLFFVSRLFGVQKLYRNTFNKYSITYAISGCIIFIGSLSLIGWTINYLPLMRLVPYGAAMNPLTAICFILLGIVSIAHNQKKDIIALCCGTFVVLSGILLLAENKGLIDFQIDTILFGNTIAKLDIPSRMAQYTALCFALLGLVPILEKSQFMKKLKLIEIVTTITMLFSALAIFGYLFDGIDLIELPLFFSAAIHTALLFLLASGFLFVQYQKLEYLNYYNWLNASGILFLTIIITVAFTGIVDRIFVQQAEAQFQDKVTSFTNKLVSRTQIYVNALEAAKGLFASSENVDRVEWKTYVDTIQIQKNYPGIQGMGYSIFVSAAEEAQHITNIRAQGFPEYRIHPQTNNDPKTAIIYLEPFDIRNQQAFGFDMYQEPTRRLALQLARDTGTAQLSGRITLVQEIDEDVQPGFLIYVPFYNNKNVETVQERRANIVGYIYAPFRARDFIEGMIANEDFSDIAIRITDGVRDTPFSDIYNDLQGKKELGQAFNAPLFTATKHLYIAGRPWTIRFRSSDSFGTTTISKVAPIITLLFGIITSCLMAFTYATLVSSRQRAVLYAKKVTQDLQKQKADLEESEQRFRGAFDTSPIGIALVSPEGKWLRVNNAISKIVGYTPDELLKLTFQDITHPEDLEIDLEYVQQMLHGEIEEYEMEKRYIHKKGHIVWIQLNVSLVRNNNEEPLYFVSLITDITERKRNDLVKSEFVSLASHQLRTPLTAVRWAVSKLSKNEKNHLDAIEKEMADTAYEASKNMAETINVMLRISHIESGFAMVKIDTFNMLALLENVKVNHANMAKNKNIQIQVQCAPGVEITSDQNVLNEILTNLVNNAIKYTPRKGHVTLTAKKHEEHIILTVEDDGYGIPSSQQEKVFSKFFRASNVVDRVSDGTGLGLYLVRSLVETAHGTIGFESIENSGTKFTITLPLEITES